MAFDYLVGSAVAVTPSDTTVFAVSHALYVGGTGDVSVRMKDGKTAIFVAVQAGTILPIQVDQVHSTNTDATSILRLYYE